MSDQQPAARPRGLPRTGFGPLLHGLATLVGGLLVLALFGLLLLATSQGSAWLVGVISDLSDERLMLTGVRGTLLSGLTVDRLQIHSGRTAVEIAPAELSMHWPDLLRRQVHLTTARAKFITIEIAPRPPDEPHSIIQPLLLPVGIAVDALEVQQIVIRRGGATVEIGPVRIEGALVDGELRFSSLTGALYGVNGDASGVFGTGEPFALDAKLHWRAAAAGVSGAGTLSGDLAALHVEQVVNMPSPVGVGGVLHLLQDQPEFVVGARWSALRRQLGAEPGGMVFTSDAGRLDVRGWTDAYRAVLDAGVQLRDSTRVWPRTRIRASAAGTSATLDFSRLLVDGLGGQVSGTGTLNLRDPRGGRLALVGRQVNPRFIDPRLDGRVDFRAGVLFDTDGNVAVTLPDAGGTLFQRPLKASGTVARTQGTWQLDKVQITAGVNHVDLSGTWGARIAGKFRVDAPDLATLWPGFHGQLHGSGVVGGTVEQPLVDLDLDGAGLASGDLHLRTLRVRGGLGARDGVSLELHAKGISWAEQNVGDLSVSGKGQLGAHTVRLDLTGGDVEAHLESAGSWRRGVLSETLQNGRVTAPGNQRWVLREPAALHLAGADFSVAAHCWSSGDAELCLADARSDAGGFAGGLTVRQFPLAGLAPWMPDHVALGGSANATLSVERAGGRVTGSLQATLQDAAVTWHVPDDDDIQTTFTEFRVNAGLTDEALEFEAVIAEAFGLHLNASGHVRDPFGETPMIDARLTGGVPDLASLAGMLERFADVGDVQGRITLDASLAGNARRPDITGGLQLEDGSFSVPAAGIKVDRVNMALLGRQDGRVALKGNAHSGKGFVALDGTLAWRDQLLPTAEATVKGRVIDVIRLPEGVVEVSPDVRVVLRNGQFRVSGDLLVPRAEIKLKKLAASAAQPSPDTIVHGRDIVVAGKAPPLFVLDGLRVNLGEKVSFDGFGLTTGLTGGLTLSQSLGADPTLVTGDGVVSVKNGKFSAFGQKLDIQRGSLIFAGVVTDPALDVKASRDVDYEGREVTVGVLLSGNISRIQTRVFSEPAMGEMDALSYLTTGKPLSAAGAGDRFSVSNAAISLGLNQALPVVQQLGTALKVDEVGIDTSEGGGTAIMIGEQLGKDLFIRYSYGIFDKLGTVRATYKLGRRVSIEASSGSAQALDLIYSVNW